MRIAYLCADRGVPVFGTKGSSVHVRELCRALRGLGHDVLLVARRVEGAPPPGLDVPVHAADGDLPTLLDRFRPDVLYERYSLDGTAGAAVAAALGVPHVLEVNAPLADEAAAHRGLADVERARRTEREVLRAADRVVAVSPWLASWLAELGVEPGRIAVLPNGVDPERFSAGARLGRAVRERLGLSGRAVVGFLGSLRPWHDVPGLVRALGALRGEGVDAALLVVGDGPERTRVEELARREEVAAVMTGAVPHDDVPGLLAAMDVAVAPYAEREGFYFSPLKLVEYLAAARPVVAADAGTIAHCVRPGETGVLYPPGDLEALADRIRALLADPAWAASLGRAGRAHVQEAHTWAAVARGVVSLVEAELGARQPA